MNMSAAAVQNAPSLEGQYFISISSHKTSNRFGRAFLVVTAELHSRMQLYNRHLPLTPDDAQARAVSDTVSIVFCGAVMRHYTNRFCMYHVKN